MFSFRKLVHEINVYIFIHICRQHAALFVTHHYALSCVSGESRGPETPAASLLWERSPPSLPRWPQCAAAGELMFDQWWHLLRFLFLIFLTSLISHIRLFWASVTFWRLIPTSYTCGIPPPSVHCCTLPVPNCRGRCWPLFAHTSLSERTVTARVVVRHQTLYSSSFLTYVQEFLVTVTSLGCMSFTVLIADCFLYKQA